MSAMESVLTVADGLTGTKENIEEEACLDSCCCTGREDRGCFGIVPTSSYHEDYKKYQDVHEIVLQCIFDFLYPKKFLQTCTLNNFITIITKMNGNVDNANKIPNSVDDHYIDPFHGFIETLLKFNIPVAQVDDENQFITNFQNIMNDKNNFHDFIAAINENNFKNHERILYYFIETYQNPPEDQKYRGIGESLEANNVKGHITLILQDMKKIFQEFTDIENIISKFCINILNIRK